MKTQLINFGMAVLNWVHILIWLVLILLMYHTLLYGCEMQIGNGEDQPSIHFSNDGILNSHKP